MMYSAVVIVPAVIIYWIFAPLSVGKIVGSVLLVLLVSLIVMILSCLLGWAVAKISLKLKNKSVITVLVSLLFFAAYYFIYFKAQSWISDLVENAAVYGAQIKNKAYPLCAFAALARGLGFDAGRDGGGRSNVCWSGGGAFRASASCASQPPTGECPARFIARARRRPEAFRVALLQRELRHFLIQSQLCSTAA